VARANAFVRGLHRSLRADPSRPLQEREFFGSMTTLDPHRLGAGDMEALLAGLDLDPATMDADGDDSDRVVILRHTLMNPFLVDSENGISYIELYFDFLAREALRLLDLMPLPGVLRSIVAPQRSSEG
jgi:hypothetical protein